MRIAIVTETFLPAIDGVVTRLTKAIDYLLAEGHEVLVIAPDLGVDAYCGARILGIPAIKLPFYPSRAFALPHDRLVAEGLAAFAPDIVHVANPVLLGASAIKAARNQRLPLLCSYHTHLPKYLAYYGVSHLLEPILWAYLRRLHNQAELNLATSRAIGDTLQRKGIKDVHLLKRGVDLAQRGPAYFDGAMRARLSGGRPEQTILLFVGRLAAEKEIHRLAALLDRRDDVVLAIVGDGPVRQELERQFAGKAAIFLGFLTGVELAQAYASADAFVFPSVSETLGLVILEAMASGLPVLAAKSPPTLEQITHQVNGLLFDADDVADLSAQVDQLAEQSLMTQICNRALSEAQGYDWPMASAQLYSYYEATLLAYGERHLRPATTFNAKGLTS